MTPASPFAILRLPHQTGSEAMVTQPISGKWYYVIKCRHCGSPIPIGEDSTNGTGPAVSWPYIRLLYECANAACRKTDIYQPAEAIRYQFPEEQA